MAAKTRTRTTQRGFYLEAMNDAERLALDEAMGVEGIDQEIALLRLRLRSAIKDSKEDHLPLMFKGIELLAKLIATRYGLGKTGRDEIQEALLEAFTELKRASGGGSDA